MSEGGGGRDRAVPEILLPSGSDDGDWEGEGGIARGNKVKLTRSDAIRDSASPPPPAHVQTQTQHVQHVDGGSNDARSIVSECDGCEPAGGDAASVTDSGRGDTDTPDGEAQYTDSTGIDLTQFIINTLNKNIKDRVLMLKLEQEMTNLVKDCKRTHHKFPHMSSYHRMLVHRVAAYFGLDHNVDQTGNCVIVNKTKTTRLPDMKFREHVPDEPTNNSEPKKLILKRESCSCDSADRHSSDTSSRRSKSIEEREEEYEKARKRIFNEICNSQPAAFMKPLYVNLGNTKGVVQARSFDVRDSARDSADRPAVSKSFSFGGYPAAQHLEPSKGPRKINTPPTLNKGQVVWAVTDVTCVPKGSVLINPDTGTPFLNSDGSVYLYDPLNPPRVAGPPDGASIATRVVVAPGEHELPPAPQASSAVLLPREMGKLSLDGGEVPIAPQVVWPHQAPAGGWMVPHPAPPARLPQPAPAVSPAAPYILVNPVSPLPHYLPYLTPGYPHGGYLPPPPAPGTVENAPANAPSSQETPQPPPQYINLSRPMFSLHRSPSNNVILFLQSCPALLTRQQLQSFLENFMTCGKSGGTIQFLDPSGKWAEISSFSPDTVVTNRFPIQIFFETEETAGPTVNALKSAGFITTDQQE